MFKLTPENYYTLENKFVSNSKVSDFLKSKEYYYAKHIEGSVEPEETPSMRLGKMIDCIFSHGGLDEFQNLYRIKDRKNNDDESYGYGNISYVTKTEYNKAVEIGQYLIKQDFYADYATTKDRTTRFQGILTGLIEGKNGNGAVEICGRPDALTEVSTKTGRIKEIIIDDLKTTSDAPMRNADTWYWHSHHMGYLRQMAAYSYMIRQRLGTRRNKVTCRHIVISTTRYPYQIKLFVIPPNLLVEPLNQFVHVARSISTEKEWNDPKISWKQAKVLRLPEQKVIYSPEEFS